MNEFENLHRQNFGVRAMSAQLTPDQFRQQIQQVLSQYNSAEAAIGQAVPDPLLVLELEAGRLVHPAADDRAALERTPDWAKALVAAALALG